MNKDEILLNLGQKIQFYRLQRGWSQEELAKRCEWSGDAADKGKSTISRIEHGKSDIQASKLKTLADVFGISPIELLQPSEADKQKAKACELFEQCYGSEVYKVVQQVIKLDQEDRLVIYGEVLGMLKAEKYKKESSEDMAI